MKPQDLFGARSAVKSAPKLTPLLIFTCLSLALMSGAILTGCSSKKSAFSGKGSPMYTGSNPVPKGGGRYKVGSPYKIIGKWYTPKENTNYDRTGTASLTVLFGYSMNSSTAFSACFAGTTSRPAFSVTPPIFPSCKARAALVTDVVRKVRPAM